MSIGLGIGLGFRHSRIAVGTQWDADAADYLGRVAIADGQALEDEVAAAVNELFVGLKDPAHPAPIALSHKAAIEPGLLVPMCGARTLDGALVPLYAGMPEVTNVGFVSGDYNRKIGLIGSSLSIKAINVGDLTGGPLMDDHAMCAMVASLGTASTNRALLSSGEVTTSHTQIQKASTEDLMRLRSANQTAVLESIASETAYGFYGISRTNSANFQSRVSGTTRTHTSASTEFDISKTKLFGRPYDNENRFDGRQSMVGFHRSVDLAYLDTVFSAYLSALALAIP